MDIKRYNGNNHYISMYTGEAFGYSKEENRDVLLKDINDCLKKEGTLNNMQLIFQEIEKWGGYECSFYNGCKEAIIIGALNTNEDYYYLYWDVKNKCIGTNTGCDSIIGKWKGIHEKFILPANSIDSEIDKYLQDNYWYEVPFTKIYKSKDWKFNFINSEQLPKRNINLKELFDN